MERVKNWTITPTIKRKGLQYPQVQLDLYFPFNDIVLHDPTENLQSLQEILSAAVTAGAEAFTFPEGRAVAAHDRLKNSKSWTLNFGEQPKNPNQGCMEEKFSIHKIAVCVPLFAFAPR